MTLPILDNHMHLNPKGRCLEAAKEFVHAGGTHIVLVSLPPGSLGIEVNMPDDYRQVFDLVLRIKGRVEAEKVGVLVVLGVHPAEISRLYKRFGIVRAVEIMKGGLDVAREYVEEGMAVGLKSGRPHYPVDKDVWDASNEIMAYSMELAKEAGCALQLHTESLDEAKIGEIASMGRKISMPLEKIVKHFAPPLISVFEKYGIFPSVISSQDAIERALSEGNRFMMETDYIDDPRRPGAVLGPKTIPKRTRQLIPKWGEEAFWRIHKENPEKVYGVEIEA